MRLSEDRTGYSVDDYLADVGESGLDEVWDEILSLAADGHLPESEVLSMDAWGDLYEMGLAKIDKMSKKELGKYYTPADVAEVMSSWLEGLDLPEVADVACGTGNLTRTYLRHIGRSCAEALVRDGHLWLYDSDSLALRIAAHAIAIEYASGDTNCIHCVRGDFLSTAVRLPDGCKVISNPPYYRIATFSPSWDVTKAMSQCRDLYGAFIEKILEQSQGSVIICPYSFLGATKFSELRDMMNLHSGHIVSFDNIPGNIFAGRKHGIFNTNHANSVRAAIIVTKPAIDDQVPGYRVSPLIRFSRGERAGLLDVQTLETLLPEGATGLTTLGYPKCPRRLEHVLVAWRQRADGTFADIASPKDTGNKRLCVPTTCRYYLSGTQRDLSRTGKRFWWLRNDVDFDYAYAMLNSSFAYWHWRLYDGGINYSLGLIQKMPTFSGTVKADSELSGRLHDIVCEMTASESDFLVYKANAGTQQENVKFPRQYRDRLNRVLLDAIGLYDVSEREFDCVHSPRVFGPDGLVPKPDTESTLSTI